MHLSWQEGQSRTVTFPGGDPACFELFANFIYTGKLFSQLHVPAQSHSGTTAATDEEWSLLARSWSLGDFLLAPHFQDAVIDTLAEIMSEHAGHHFPPEIYEIACLGGHTTMDHKTQSHGLRRFLVEAVAWYWTPAQREALPDTVTGWQLFKDYVLRDLEEMSTSSPKMNVDATPFSACRFHVHGPNGVCYKQLFGS